MVSAVFHSPLAAVSESLPETGAAESPARASARPAVRAMPPASPAKPSRDWRAGFMTVVPPLLGLALLVGIWALVSSGTKGSIPGPLATWQQALTIFSDPFYRKGPNDQGVGWNVLMSLERVALGFRRRSGPSSSARSGP